jgi:hypothetical protein
MSFPPPCPVAFAFSIPLMACSSLKIATVSAFFSGDEQFRRLDTSFNNNPNSRQDDQRSPYRLPLLVPFWFS